MKEKEKELEKEKKRLEKEKEKDKIENEKKREKEEKKLEKERNREKEREKLEKELEKKKEKENEKREERLRAKEKEEREKEEKRRKEEREKEKQRLREERKRYNERFQNTSNFMKRNNRRYFINSQNEYPESEKKRTHGGYFLRLTYSNRLNRRKRRRYSHKRIQPKNRITKIEPKKNLGKTSIKIIKPKKYTEDDESETEPVDFEEKLMKFPRFRAKYGKNYSLRNDKEFINLTSYLTENSGKNKNGTVTKNNLTISEVNEDEEEKNNLKYLKNGKLAKIKTRGNMEKQMRDILGKQYKFLVDDPLNPYGTYWPSNFLKVGYGAGFEYNQYQSGVPVLKLKSLGKKQLPPIKKKELHFNNDNSIYSNENGGINFHVPFSGKKNKKEEILGIKTNKSETFHLTKIKLNENIAKRKIEKTGGVMVL